MSIVIESTTDSKEAVTAALGNLASKKESEVEQKSVSAQQDEQGETTENSDISDKESNEESSDYEADDEADDSESDSEEIKDDEKPKKKKGGFKKRIERFQKQLSVKDQEIEFLKQQMSKGKPSDEAAQAKPQVDMSSKPTPDKFETHEEYIDALTDWKIESKEKLKEQKAKESEAKSEYQKQIESYQSKVLEVKKTHDDFDDVMEDVDDIKVSAAVHQIILDSDFGPNLAYELAKNKSEFERINKLSPLAAAKEIGKIEARLSNQSESKKEIKVTKAPQPLKAVGAGSKGSIQKSPDDMSFDEYKAWRKTQK
jgi:hypothetical protein